MSIKQLYEFALIELNKVKAPTMLVEDYVYLLNKAIQQYINLAYSRADYNQQSTDDLACLQTSVIIDASKSKFRDEFNDRIWTFDLPKDYIHMLNCMASFKHSGNGTVKRCSNNEDKIDTVSSLCRRMTADTYPMILQNHYMKPSHKRPYWYISNRNSGDGKSGDVIDFNGHNITPTNYDRDLAIRDNNYEDWNPSDKNEGLDPNDKPDYRDYEYVNLKNIGDRTTHRAPLHIEIHGGDDKKWELDKVYITYLKAPMYVSMTEDDVLSIEDTTMNMEFPDYICYEIINLFVWLVMENQSDPRMQTNPIMNKTIPTPNSGK